MGGCNSVPKSPDARSAVNDQARALQRVLQPSSLVPVGTGPSPDSIRALASVFGGAKGFVSHDVIVQLVRVEASVLTRRLYRLFPRHTLEEFLSALANVKHLRRLRTPRSAFATAAVLTEKEARLEFAFELYDLDGDGFVTEAELLEVVDKTMLGNAAKIASTLRVAMKVVGDGSDASENAFSNPVGVGTSTVSDHPRLDFQLFKKLAGRIPSVLFPAQTLYELLFEFGGGAKFVLDALRALEADTRYSLSRDGSGWAGPDSNGTPSVSGNTSPRSGSPGKGNGNGNRFVKTARDATCAVRERCAMMRKPELVKFLETLGMDLGLELMTFDELVDLAAAGALSTGRLAELPRQANGETQNSPLSSPSRRAQVRKPPGRQPRPARAPLSSTGNLADDFKQRSDDIIQGAFRAARMGRADVLAEMIRGGDVGADAVDKANDHRFNLLMVASMSGMKVVCKRLLGLGADVSAVDKHGHTALDLALKYGHDATADYLGRVGVPLGRKERDFPEYTPHVPERNAHEASAPPVPTHFTGQAQEQSIFPEQEQQGIVPYGETSSPGSTASLPRDEGPLLSPE